VKKFFQIRPTKTVLSIIITIIIGFLIGIFSTNTLPKTVYEIDEEKKSYVQIFLNSFSLNYWYFFVLWFFGMIPFGFCLSYFITFFKSFMCYFRCLPKKQCHVWHHAIYYLCYLRRDNNSSNSHIFG